MGQVQRPRNRIVIHNESENTEQTTSPEETENSEVDTTQAASPEKELEGTSTESDSQ